MNFNIYFLIQIVHKNLSISNSRLPIISEYTILIYATVLYEEQEGYDVFIPSKSSMKWKR